MRPSLRSFAAGLLILLRIAGAGADEPRALPREADSLRAAIEDLMATFGPRYAIGPRCLAQLERLQTPLRAGDAAAAKEFERLRQEALLANPLLQENRLLLVKRAPRAQGKKKGWRPPPGFDVGMPSNHECNTSLPRDGYDNELCLLWPVPIASATAAPGK